VIVEGDVQVDSVHVDSGRRTGCLWKTYGLIIRDVYVLLHFESRKFQKSPPKGRKGVYEENSDFRGKKNNSQELPD
jgi:hypothetical protein